MRCGRRVGGVTALGDGVVQRVVAPVEAINAANCAESRLGLLVGIGGRAASGFFVYGFPGGLIFVGAGEIEGWQQVDVGQPGLSQPGQVLHAVRVRNREGFEGAAQFLRHARVGGAEIAHMQFVDHDVFGGVQFRFFELIPSLRLIGFVQKVDDLAAFAVGREAERIGIGHQVGLDLAGGRHKTCTSNR
jgi:hypothetical protein